MIQKAIILLSGGIDSSTTAAVAKKEGYELYALSFDYAQRHNCELRAAKMVAKSLGAKRHLTVKFDTGEIGGSALTSDIKVPKDRKALSAVNSELQEKSCITHCVSRAADIPITYVPARNTIFLSFAIAWAETLEISDIFIGANVVDYSGYPDCRPEYLKAFEKMANLATKVSVEENIKFKIKSPLLHMTKAEIIKKGTELGLDYSITWSCYDPQPEGVKSSKLKVQSFKEENSFLSSSLITRHLSLIPCGRCDSCIFRAKGFKEFGKEDPI